MFQKDFAVYLGKEREKGFSGFIAEEKFFLILVIEEGLDQELGQDFILTIKKEIISRAIDHLADFEAYISEKIKEKNLPASLSLSTGFVKGNILYLKTIGQGEVYIIRGDKLIPIISGNLSASGYIKPNDLFIFTTTSFMKLVEEEDLKSFFDKKNPHEIIEQITPELKRKENEGMIALLVQFKEEKEKKVFAPLIFKSSIIDKIFSLYKDTLLYHKKIGRKKIITFMAVFIIFFILVWSVFLGYQRRKQAVIKKRIQTTKTLVVQKLEEAGESSFFSMTQAKNLINEATSEVEQLRKEVGVRKETEELVKLIKKTENEIFKREEKKAEEFFDLAVDYKQAKGDKLYLDDSLIAILDSGGGNIYTLSLLKKSLDKRNFNEIKRGELLASYQNEIFFYISDEGLYKIDSQGKLKRVVEKDNDWGKIVDFWIYNGNLYLLDEEKGDIYKYLVAADSYSAKTSYFKGGTFGLKKANSLAIDFSVYVGFSDRILKFTSGTQDEFKTSFPESSVQLKKIFTTKNLEKIYAWDKSKGTIYILGKNGTYERQVNSYLLKEATDFIVYQNWAYILSGSKIYKMSLD